MKYWENGFYLEQNKEKTRTEITDEYWQELLTGQSKGKIIVSNENNYPILKDYEPSQKELDQQEYTMLVDWFNNNYTYKEQKLRRLYTLKINCDDGTDPYNQLLLLYKQAEEKRKRIQELELLI